MATGGSTPLGGIMAGALGTGTAQAEKEIDFIDSSVFDNQLSSAMLKATQEITVFPVAGMTVNEIPERLNKWLSAVSNYGGDIRVEPRSRSMGLLMEMAESLFKMVQEEMTYRQAGQYDAVIYYREDDGKIEKVLFTRR